MTLPLNPHILAAAYDFLCATQPFSTWNLPDSEDVTFKVARDPNLRGWHTVHKGKHLIAISRRCIGRTSSLVLTMAHEMVHMHQRHACMDPKAEHGAAFQKLAAQVCRVHGFDEKLF